MTSQREPQSQWSRRRRGRAGPKGRIQERLAGFRDLTTAIEGMFSAHDKSSRVYFGAELIRFIWGHQGRRQAGGGPRLCGLAFEGGKVAENINDTGSVHFPKADWISFR